ncbi:MAG: M18 family aminopeptidase, partial [Clostridia bacterium]|nr:M18 family aminopeptidase [Clostridia bacterium]
MSDHVQSFLDFIQHSPCSFHAVSSIVQALKEAGYEELAEGRPWAVVPGGKYYVTRNRSAVVAFHVPACGFSHFQ